MTIWSAVCELLQTQQPARVSPSVELLVESAGVLGGASSVQVGSTAASVGPVVDVDAVVGEASAEAVPVGSTAAGVGVLLEDAVKAAGPSRLDSVVCLVLAGRLRRAGVVRKKKSSSIVDGGA